MADPKIPYKQQPIVEDIEFNLEDKKVPIWANLLYGGLRNRADIEKTLDKWEKDPSLMEPLAKGLLGQYMLSKVLPQNMKADLKTKSIDYSPTDNLDIGLSKRGNTNFLNLGWRF